ncbi:hypothetical protein GO013_14310 [Pseudodesulfovibrio sp. JC047]|uniref:Tim44 domain-containing protein n=1 Tax=Pseudodesulfovibrio sp. JC047 TaxID=2683199 RepID=UPI0013D65C2F|nr:Tim44-like domain-containing protein [Pseudodesulfovibrio sp. JC047]NDV20581.1 hypothetical protein [Pseudodesulfovibrio sp. JC047]
MIASSEILDYIQTMHTHIFSFLPKWVERLSVRLFGALFVVLVLAPSAFAQESPASRGGGILNILFLGVIAYFLVRAFRRRSGNDQSRPGQWGRQDQDEEQSGDARKPSVRPVDRHEAARQTWDMLRSDDAEQSPSSAQSIPHAVREDGFDEAEFLEGAKVFFSRFQQANDAQDFETLRSFISDEVYQDALKTVGQGRTEVMLLTAKMMDMKSENGRTMATVFYDAQLRVGEDGHPVLQRVVWEFSRDDSVSGALWVLEKINKVDQ